MSEQLLGNERVVRKLVSEGDPLVDRVISWAENVKKTLSDKGEKFTLAEKRRMDKALKLYLKAAEASGKTRLAGRIRAMLKEEEKENDLDSKGETEYNYSRKVPPTDEYATYAMQWAYSDKTAVGEQKLFYRKGKWVLLEKSDDGFVEMGSYSDKQRKIIAEELKNYNEELYEQRTGERAKAESLRENIVLFRSTGTGDSRDNINGLRGSPSDERIGELYREESEGNRSGDYKAGEHDNRGQVKYSYKTDQERSTLTKGEAQKQRANYESDRVYTKAEIAKMVESLNGLSSIPKRFRTDIVNDIWTAFNSRYSPDQREIHASILANKIFTKVMQESGDTFDNTSQEELYAMEREIHSALKKIAREGGAPSTRSKLEAEFDASKAGYWKKQRDEAYDRIKITGKLMDAASKMRSLKVGDFLKASSFKSDDLKSTVEQLARVNFRGNLNVSGTRGLVSKLSEWYVKDNPMLKAQKNGDQDSVAFGQYDEHIAYLLNKIANGTTGFSNAELTDLNTVILSLGSTR